MNYKKLFTEAKILNNFSVKNRIFMSSMQRGKGTVETGLATDIMNLYYSQRIGAGLIYSEPLFVCRNSISSIRDCGLWSDSQIEGWKEITNIIHSNNSKIFASLSHSGRSAHSSINNNLQPVSASAIKSEVMIYPLGKPIPAELPREITIDEINKVINLYYESAIRAKMANFDGINIHCSSGCLIESFLKSISNNRNDIYGGDDGIEILVKIIEAVSSVFDPKLISVKLSAVDHYGGMFDKNPKDKYSKVIRKISKVGFVEIKESNNNFYNKNFGIKPTEQIESCVHYFGKLIKELNLLLVANLVSKPMDERIQYIENDIADFISCATLFISNPNLVEKIKNNIALTLPEKIYNNSGSKGYTDYL